MSEILDDFNQPLSTERKRHGCVTAWLILMLVTNVLLVITYFIGGDMIAENLPEKPPLYFMYLLGGLGMINVVSAYFLLQWKKVGFYGFIGSSILALGVNAIMGLGMSSSISGLIGIAILYGILQIKATNQPSAWEMLE